MYVLLLQHIESTEFVLTHELFQHRTDMSSMEKSTVILGAGIIGVSTAYYLAQADPSLASSIHLVDSSPELFASASGKAGGFLAADCMFRR